MRQDFLIENHGSLVLFQPLTTAAREWWQANCADGQVWGSAYVVEPRYAADIAEGAREAGLSIR